MTVDEIKTEVIKLISELFKDMGFAADIIEYADLVDDMGMDSITFITIIVELEAKFDITVPDNMLLMDNFKKVDDIIAIVAQEMTILPLKTEETEDDKA